MIALDTNLLILLVVGLTDPRLIVRHKRLGSFVQDDFKGLAELLREQGGRLLLTPNTLTETSNLLDHGITGPARQQLWQRYQILISNESAFECYVPSKQSVEHPQFTNLGLTDCVMLNLPDDAILLTADFPLFCAATSLARPAINFHHLREQWL